MIILMLLAFLVVLFLYFRILGLFAPYVSKEIELTCEVFVCHVLLKLFIFMLHIIGAAAYYS